MMDSKDWDLSTPLLKGGARLTSRLGKETAGIQHPFGHFTTAADDFRVLSAAHDKIATIFQSELSFAEPS